MNVVAAPLAGVLVLEPTVYQDARGFFMETYQASRYGALGIDAAFVQDNLSRSVRGTVRGLHYQQPHPQGKLVQTVRGAVFDVVVDIRRRSPTFQQWFSVELSDENRRQLWIPPGYAHGFCAMSEVADVIYKCTTPYVPEANHAILWNDPDIGIAWPVREPILSPKDLAAPRLRDAPVLPEV
ncbi:MAG TPA: dTDP-4-dehydrorhamnose 3,5-epimerase [Polyangia bacterium]|nr:dTDP-4-dehydrorhamnose 3,5-epimerase [Polyangia bacterium]